MTMTAHRKKSRALVLILLSVLVGFFASVAIRYVTYKDTSVHYHANFALYVNGQRDQFKSFTFYEEVQSCTSDVKNNPRDRVHMHNQNNGLVHVHASGATWGHFFANLKYGLSDKVLQTDNGSFVSTKDGAKLTFILNGQPVSSIANTLIKSEDRLLINYGSEEDAALLQRYQTVPSDAKKANSEKDPSSCKGGHDAGTWHRLKKSVIY